MTPAFRLFLFMAAACLAGLSATAQDSLLAEVSLTDAVQYSLKHQPAILQSQVDERITDANIRSRLADWYPQVDFNFVLQHNFQLQTSIFQGNPVRIGVDNTSTGAFTLRQTIFDRSVLLASRTRRDVVSQSRQTTASNKISIAAAVSKAFYDVLATTQQVKVSTQNIVRIERSLQDAFNQYKAGITDKTDYKRAGIALNNAKALKKSNEEGLKAKKEYLKMLMGYPAGSELNIHYDSLQMEKEAGIDTNQTVDYTSRIEYKLLSTQKSLLDANLKYERMSYLPTLAANGAYNLNYLNDKLSKLYQANYPNSFAALTLDFPIFQGGRRKANIDAARFQLERNRLDLVNLRNSVNSEYVQALSNYKANWADYVSLKENLALAQEVYNVIQLQYRNGIKAYIEVINAETDLRTAEINYYNALYNLLASKIDVQKALGQINY